MFNKNEILTLLRLGSIWKQTLQQQMHPEQKKTKQNLEKRLHKNDIISIPH